MDWLTFKYTSFILHYKKRNSNKITQHIGQITITIWSKHVAVVIKHDMQTFKKLHQLKQYAETWGVRWIFEVQEFNLKVLYEREFPKTLDGLHAAQIDGAVFRKSIFGCDANLEIISNKILYFYFHLFMKFWRNPNRMSGRNIVKIKEFIILELFHLSSSLLQVIWRKFISFLTNWMNDNILWYFLTLKSYFKQSRTTPNCNIFINFQK